MTVRRRGLLLLLIQAALVLTVAAKYEWERHVRPMVWTRAEPLGLRTLTGDGRYERLQLTADGCDLPLTHIRTERTEGVGAAKSTDSYRILEAHIHTIARQGKLVALAAGELASADVQRAQWDMRRPCSETMLQDTAEVYVPRHIGLPFTLPPGSTLWVLVTVPGTGPPRPVQLAISDATGFHPWNDD